MWLVGVEKCDNNTDENRGVGDTEDDINDERLVVDENRRIDESDPDNTENSSNVLDTVLEVETTTTFFLGSVLILVATIGLPEIPCCGGIAGKRHFSARNPSPLLHLEI